jgi:hypothetical protein
MSTADPRSPRRCPALSEVNVTDWDTERNWLLAISLIAAWRRNGGAPPQTAVVQRLAEMTAEAGAATVEQVALGLADVASTLLELYADCVARSPDDVLQDAATLQGDKRLRG